MRTPSIGGSDLGSFGSESVSDRLPSRRPVALTPLNHAQQEGNWHIISEDLFITLTLRIPNNILTAKTYRTDWNARPLIFARLTVIDIGNEQLVSLRDVPKLLPPRPNGKRVHISAVYRWIQRGVHRARLEVIRIGGSTYTSREALQRFASPSDIPRPTVSHSSAARERRIDKAVRRVQAILYPGRRVPESNRNDARTPTDGVCPPRTS